MNNIRRFVYILVIICLGSVYSIRIQAQNKMGFSYDNSWRKIDSLTLKGLSQSAKKEAEKVYAQAVSEGEIPHYVKALLVISQITQQIAEESDSINLKRFKEAYYWAPSPGKQILASYIAQYYWSYYSNKRYRILERTKVFDPTKSLDDGKFEEWDAYQFHAVIDYWYQLSLSQPDSLKEVASTLAGELLTDSSATIYLRPTLYDLLVHRALDYYKNLESGLTSPKEAFTISAEDALIPYKAFIEWKPEMTDTLSKKYRWIRCFQDLLQFHDQRVKDNEQDAVYALVDADLVRLNYLKGQSIGVQKDTLYLRSLEGLAETYASHPSSAQIQAQIAEVYDRRGNLYRPFEGEAYKWDKKKAISICEEVIKQFPDSYGADQCKQLMARVKFKSLSLNIEEANLPNKPFRFLLTYKNFSKAFIKIVPYDNTFDKLKRRENILEWILKQKIVNEWEVDLNGTEDFQSHQTEIPAEGLPVGDYLLLVSDVENLDPDDYAIAHTRFQVTQLAMIWSRQDGNALDVFVMDRANGEPKEGVKVQLRDWDYNKRTYVTNGIGEETNELGYARLTSPRSSYQHDILITYDKDKFHTGNVYLYSDNTSRENTRLYFFTDRKIYRPGQTIYYKAIALKGNNENTRILPGTTFTIDFYDVNYQKVASENVTTNEFGTVAGNFIAPSAGLLGNMTIQSKYGQTSVSVEEYKRPTFEVALDKVTGAYSLGEEIIMSGKAMTFSGTPLNNVKVRYSVERRTRYPYWFSYFRSYAPPSNQQVIIQGDTETNEEGILNFSFELTPDPSVDPNTKPVFTYQIKVEVIDISGETREVVKSVQAAYNPLIVSASLPGSIEYNKVPGILIEARNLNGSIEAVEGQIQVTPLKAPARYLRKRLWDRPDEHILSKSEYLSLFPHDIYGAEDQYANWEEESPLELLTFNTENDSSFALRMMQGKKPGWYKVKVSTESPKVELIHYIEIRETVEFEQNGTYLFKTNFDKQNGEPGENIQIQLNSGFKDVWVLYSLFQQNKIIASRWVELKKKPVTITIPLEESYRGNIAANLTAVYHNDLVYDISTIEIPWTNKQLKLSWGTFRSKLYPGQEEQWKLKISGTQSEAVAAELVATLYDASLDQFRPNQFQLSIFQTFPYYYPWQSSFRPLSSSLMYKNWNKRVQSIFYRKYPSLISEGYFSYGYYFLEQSSNRPKRALFRNRQQGEGQTAYAAAPVTEEDRSDESSLKNISARPAQEETDSALSNENDIGSEGENNSSQDLSQITIRTNLNETAFFFPQLQTNEEGEIELTFQMPEALTRWKFLGLAHTKDLQIGTIGGETVTQKELMVNPFTPRFLRENDTIVLKTKISNLTDSVMKAIAEIRLLNAFDMQSIIEDFQVVNIQREVEIPAKGSQEVSWEVIVPETYQAVVLQYAAQAGDFTDGEEHVIPVLKNRKLVTESLPLSIKGRETKTFAFNRLLQSNSPTLQHQRFTLEFTANPAWYVIQALPYLMEFPHNCTEQLFSRLYANSVASSIANQHPSIKNVFDQWMRNAQQGSKNALLSQLEKNQELKEVVLAETPWVLDAQDEATRKKRVGVLFDLNRMAKEQSATLEKLRKRQLSNGAFTWFPGMPENRYITQLIIKGIGQLQKMGINMNGNPEMSTIVQQAIPYMDAQIQDDYQRLVDNNINLEAKRINYTQIQYLYMRSFFPDIAQGKESVKAYEYFYNQAKSYWVEQPFYLQGMLSLVFYRNGDEQAASDIVAALEENAIFDDEMGMYWKSGGIGLYWYQAPIEMQSLLIEVFEEVAKDYDAVEEMKIWLLKQKQTQDWETTKASVAACNALLSSGTNWLATDPAVKIKIGEEQINPTTYKDANAEVGTGYFKKAWVGSAVKEELGNITVDRTGEGISWGAAYWQYFEQLDKIEQGGNDISLEKELFLVRSGANGEELVKVGEDIKLHPGDKVVVRMVLKSDRELEYVHLKDQRAAGMEPIDVISSYKYQGGIGYYESTKDAATHFFMDRFPKGTHVFEYPLRVVHEGNFSAGVANIQCMYAPEFTAHSEGTRVRIE